MNNIELAASQIAQAIANLRRERTVEAEALIGKLGPLQAEASKLAEAKKSK